MTTYKGDADRSYEIFLKIRENSTYDAANEGSIRSIKDITKNLKKNMKFDERGGALFSTALNEITSSEIKK